MRATDEQIERVKHASFHFGGLPTSVAIDAVLSELAALRGLRDALIVWQREGESSISGEEFAAALAACNATTAKQRANKETT